MTDTHRLLIASCIHEAIQLLQEGKTAAALGTLKFTEAAVKLTEQDEPKDRTSCPTFR